MPRVSELIIAVEAEGVPKVLDALNQVEGAQTKVSEASKKTAAATGSLKDQSGKNLVEFGRKWQGTVSSIMSAAIPITMTVGGIKKAMDFSREGASIEYLYGKFDRLSTSIGGVSDKLLNNLRKATRGTKSDMELVASASDFMALGLAKTEDEVIRLTNVAGALGMNMNQLVLTLTNQTTMRFDALGVAVEGFQERVDALQKQGMSQSEAFTEAFLQQAEAQVATVGHIADSSAGQWAKVDASWANLMNNMKRRWADFTDGIDGKGGLAGGIQGAIDQLNAGQDYGSLIEDLTELGFATERFSEKFKNIQVATGKPLDIKPTVDALRWMKDEFKSLTDGGMRADEAIAQVDRLYNSFGNLVSTGPMTQAWADANDRIWESTTAAADGLLFESEAVKNLRDSMEGIVGLSANFGGVVKLAVDIDDALKAIKVQEDIMANTRIGSEKYEEAKKKVEELKDSIIDMANQMTLDMMMATISVNGITEAEAGAYFKMAEDMGIISKEAADTAMKAYGNAVKTINGMRIDDKKGNVVLDPTAAFATLDLLQAYQFAPKEVKIFMKEVAWEGAATENWALRNDQGYSDNRRALGGPVYPGRTYLVGEQGPEPFTPSVAGWITPNGQAPTGGGESHVHYHIHNDFDWQKAKREFAREMVR